MMKKKNVAFQCYHFGIKHLFKCWCVVGFQIPQLYKQISAQEVSYISSKTFVDKKS